MERVSFRTSPWFDSKGDPVCPGLLAVHHSTGEYEIAVPKECWKKSKKIDEKTEKPRDCDSD
jgi:hypothetical protein